MERILFETDNKSIKPVVTKSNYTAELYYPCEDSSSCTYYTFVLPPGAYTIEAYGASGGESFRTTTYRKENELKCIPQDRVTSNRGNTVCNPYNAAGAGGFVSGVIHLRRSTKIYATIGGADHTQKGDDNRGGYNGGGSSDKFRSPPTSGGGATDIRIGEYDLWHRILVAGGGGGIDDYPVKENTDEVGDGAGGAGGYPNSQSYWIDGVYNSSFHVATQESGFTFGQGEPAKKFRNGGNPQSADGNYDEPETVDCAGAGGGWFGGFSSRQSDGGAAGGSSFALTKDAIIPSGKITAHNEEYEVIGSHEYAFTHSSEYCLTNFQYANGIWGGNGLIRITALSALVQVQTCECNSMSNSRFVFLMTALFLVVDF